jgi:hypothetical protein
VKSQSNRAATAGDDPPLRWWAGPFVRLPDGLSSVLRNYLLACLRALCDTFLLTSLPRVAFSLDATLTATALPRRRWVRWTSPSEGPIEGTQPPRLGGRFLRKRIITYFSRGTLIESAAKWACPAGGQTAHKPFPINESQHVVSIYVCDLLRFYTRGAPVPKLKYWDAAKGTFAHQGINNLRMATRIGFGTRRAVCERAREEKNLHTKKFFQRDGI